MPRRTDPQSRVVSCRMSDELHVAATAAARATGTSVGTWLRDRAALAVGVEIAPVRRRPSRPRRQVPDRQLALREAVRALGVLGVAVVDHGIDNTLAAEIRAALVVVVAAVTPTR